MGRPEAKIEKYLAAKAKANGWLCPKFTSGDDGVPDRILIARGRSIYIELKRSDNGKPSVKQLILMERLRRNGQECLFCSTRETVDTILKSVENDQPIPVMDQLCPMQPYPYNKHKSTRRKTS